MRRAGIVWDKTCRLDGGLGRACVRWAQCVASERRACVSVSVWCTVYVLKPNRRQATAPAWPECREEGKHLAASNFFSGSWWGGPIDRDPGIDRQGSHSQGLVYLARRRPGSLARHSSKWKSRCELGRDRLT